MQTVWSYLVTVSVTVLNDVAVAVTVSLHIAGEKMKRKAMTNGWNILLDEGE